VFAVGATSQAGARTMVWYLPLVTCQSNPRLPNDHACYGRAPRSPGTLRFPGPCCQHLVQIIFGSGATATTLKQGSAL
jgi:hypothetical protein